MVDLLSQSATKKISPQLPILEDAVMFIRSLCIALALAVSSPLASAQSALSVFESMDRLEWLAEGIVFHTVTDSRSPKQGQFLVLRCDVEHALRTDGLRICNKNVYTHCVITFTGAGAEALMGLHAACLASDGSWHIEKVSNELAAIGEQS